jgi:hypothetical protein
VYGFRNDTVDIAPPRVSVQAEIAFRLVDRALPLPRRSRGGPFSVGSSSGGGNESLQGLATGKSPSADQASFKPDAAYPT